jgi:hypothetical protein
MGKDLEQPIRKQPRHEGGVGQQLPDEADHEKHERRNNRTEMLAQSRAKDCEEVTKSSTLRG